PVVERYLAHFDRAIKTFDLAESQEVSQEIRSHIAEACAAGRPLDDVLRSLGPADVLARAYGVELLLNGPKHQRIHELMGFLRVPGLVAAASFATFVVVGVLGTMGLGFTASGVVIMGIGGLEQAGLHLSGVQMNGVAPFSAILLGLVVAAVGVLSLMGLRLYVRLVIRRLKTFRSAGQPAPASRDRLRDSPRVV